jgi:hypothetical protein
MKPGALVSILQAAAPGLRVSGLADPWHGNHARADLPDAQAVQFAYLFEEGDGMRLSLYPADTLTQARIFYGDDARVRATLDLAAGGEWEVEPNFHFGYMEKGLTWTSSPLPLRDYTDYWRSRISTINVITRAEWERELGRLIRDRIFDEHDRVQFERDFTETDRNEASPRPGLKVSRRWPHDEAEDSDFALSLSRSLASALAAFGEHRSLRALAPPGR